MVVCKIDLKVGGRLRYVWRKADGMEMGLGGGYREIVPPERIVLTELFDINWTGGETLNTVIFTEQNGKTTLTNTVGYSSREGRDGAFNSGSTQGMAASYDRLAELLTSTSA